MLLHVSASSLPHGYDAYRSFNVDPKITSFVGYELEDPKTTLSVSMLDVSLIRVTKVTYFLFATPGASPTENPLHILGVKLSNAFKSAFFVSILAVSYDVDTIRLSYTVNDVST